MNIHLIFILDLYVNPTFLPYYYCYYYYYFFFFFNKMLKW